MNINIVVCKRVAIGAPIFKSVLYIYEKND